MVGMRYPNRGTAGSTRCVPAGATTDQPVRPGVRGDPGGGRHGDRGSVPRPGRSRPFRRGCAGSPTCQARAEALAQLLLRAGLEGARRCGQRHDDRRRRRAAAAAGDGAVRLSGSRPRAPGRPIGHSRTRRPSVLVALDLPWRPAVRRRVRTISSTARSARCCAEAGAAPLACLQSRAGREHLPGAAGPHRRTSSPGSPASPARRFSTITCARSSAPPNGGTACSPPFRARHRRAPAATAGPHDPIPAPLKTT